MNHVWNQLVLIRSELKQKQFVTLLASTKPKTFDDSLHAVYCDKRWPKTRFSIFLQQNQEEVRYQSGTEEIDFSNPIYGDNRKAATSKPSNKEWAEKLKKDSDGLVQNNLDPTSVIKRNDVKVRCVLDEALGSEFDQVNLVSPRSLRPTFTL